MIPIVTYTNYETVFGRKPSEEELVEWVSGLSLGDCLHTIGKMSHALAADTPEGQQIILGIVLSGLPKPQQERLLGVLADGSSRRLIFAKQLLALARVALLHAEDRLSDSFGGGVDLPKFVAALLGVADVYDTTDAEAATVENGIPAEEFFCSFRLRRVGMPDRHPVHSLLRTMRVFVDLPERHPDLVTTVKPGQAFEAEVGLSLERYLAVCVAANIRFATWNGNADAWMLDQGWWGQTALHDEEIERALATVSATPMELKEAIEEQLAIGRRSIDDIRPVMIKPLIRVGSTAYLPLDLQTLMDALLGDGLFWRLKPAQGATQKERSDFGESLGHLLEAHCLQVVEACLPDLSNGCKRVFPEFRYKVQTAEGDEPKDGPDVIVAEPGAAAFVEIGIDRVHVRDTLGAGDMESFRKDAKRIILHRAAQLSEKIDHARSGALTLQKSPEGAFDRIFPVICIWDGFPLGPYLYDRVLAMVRDEGYLTQENVAPLRIISVEDFELLCALAAKGRTISSVLRAHEESGWHDDSIGSFLRDAYADELELPEPLKSEFPQVLKRLVDQLFGATHAEAAP
ncbi:MAG TPA: hypothetical protein VNH40_00790 [Gaiellaceae bacterium]|nr:hypothetical protein [Gaiellaceae bacterium]